MAIKSHCIGLLATADQSVVSDMLDVIIGEVVLFFNVGKTMVPAQIKSTINLILNDSTASSLTFEDYKVCFDNIKKGVYGKSFDRIDGQIFLMCIHTYFSEKSAIIEQANELQHDRLKNQTRSSSPLEKLMLNDDKYLVSAVDEVVDKPTPEQWKELKDNLKKLAKNTNAREIQPREKTEQEKLIQRFMRQFDKIWLRKGIENPGGKFIHMYGVKGKDGITPYINLVEYVEHKLKQHNRLKNDKTGI